MQAEPPRLREAAEDVVGEPGIELERELGGGPAAEIDGGAGERVVHRHDRVAVARDAAAVAERAVERLAERERRVLGGVVLARLEVAGRLEHEVEAGVEGELLEEVVVEPGAGRDAHAARAVESEANADARLGGRADVADAASGRARDGRGPVERAGERLEQQVVVLAVADRDADPVREDAHDEARAEERCAERLRVVDRDEEEVRARRQRLEPERAQAAREPLALLDLRRRRRAGRRAPASASAAESVEIGAGAWRRFSSAAVSASASA